MHYRDMTRKQRLTKSSRLREASLREHIQNQAYPEEPRHCDAFFSYISWVSQMLEDFEPTRT